MNKTYIDSLSKHVSRFQSNKITKVMHQPVRMFLSSMLPKLAEKTGRPITAKADMFWGGGMTIVLPEAVSAVIYRYGYFEEELTRYILDNVSTGMVFFDIGAHFGYFSLLASKIVGSEGRVCSFDPTPSTFKVLSANLKSSNNSELYNTAVWSSEKILTLHDYGLKYASLNSLLKVRSSSENNYKLDDNSYSVKTISMDNYCRDNNIYPDFVKIDAESAELEILKGMEKVIRTVKPMITVEVGDEGDPEAYASRILVDHLMSRGYKVYEYKNGKTVPHQPVERYTYNNLLFKHSAQ